MKSLSTNWKIAIGFVLAILIGAPFESLNPTDGSTSVYHLVLGGLFAFFIWHLVAQRGQRVGFSYGATYVCAMFFLPLTALVVFVFRKKSKS